MKDEGERMSKLKLTKEGRQELRLLIFELSAELNSISSELIQKALSDAPDDELYEEMFTLLDTYLPSMKHTYEEDFEQIEDKHVFFENAS
jgi:hypothetical protein